MRQTGHSSTDGVRAYKRTSTNLKQATSNVLNSRKQEKTEDNCKELDSLSLNEPAMILWSYLYWQYFLQSSHGTVWLIHFFLNHLLLAMS